MIHNVIENVDRGEVIRSVKTRFTKNDDTIDTLNDRIKSYEIGSCYWSFTGICK